MTDKHEKRQTIFIEPEYVIVNLIQADKNKYLTIPRLFRFAVYLHKQLSKKAGLPPDCDVLFDISFDSIERTVWYNKQAFRLTGDIIFLKNGELPETPDNVKEFLRRVAEEFAEKFAA